MAVIEFTILGPPKAQKRHRDVQCGKFRRRYDPSTKEKETFAQLVQRHAPDELLRGPVCLSWAAYFPRPQSHYRTGRYAGQLKPTAPLWHTKRPDRDNVDKFLMDAMTGIFWAEDAIVCAGTLIKKYDARPRIEVTVETLKEH
jgi:Holliday junction resolvase RusA-like endonuclease